MDKLQNILQDLCRDSQKAVILDTDTYNEVDDQFALAYAMLSPERIRLLAVTAAPFLNFRSTSSRDGMLKSYDEIRKIIRITDPTSEIPVYQGAGGYLTDAVTPQVSDASDAIVRLVQESNQCVYIIAIGCITNVASAILQCPEICRNAAVIWLGGHALHWKDTKEFNMKQDLAAARVVFESGIPLIQIPCRGMCSELLTTIPELRFYLQNQNHLCDYLLEMTGEFAEKAPYAWSKVLWDVAAVAAVVKPEGLDKVVIPQPLLTSDGFYAFDAGQKKYIYTRKVFRDIIFADLFRKLSELNRNGKDLRI